MKEYILKTDTDEVVKGNREKDRYKPNYVPTFEKQNGKNLAVNHS